MRAAMAEARLPASPGTLGAGLSFVAGFVDSLGFVALFSLFTAHVTGNFVLLGAALIQPGSGVITKLLALPVFMATVAVVCLLVRIAERSARPVLIPLLVLQTLLLAAYMAAGLASVPIVDADAVSAVITGLIGVVAMAVQNAGARLAVPTLVPTTVMTGNVTQFVIDAVDALRVPATELRTVARARLKRFLPAILSFSIGAIAGAVMYARFSFGGLALPLVILIAIVVIEMRRA